MTRPRPVGCFLCPHRGYSPRRVRIVFRTFASGVTSVLALRSSKTGGKGELEGHHEPAAETYVPRGLQAETDSATNSCAARPDASQRTGFRTSPTRCHPPSPPLLASRDTPISWLRRELEEGADPPPAPAHAPLAQLGRRRARRGFLQPATRRHFTLGMHSATDCEQLLYAAKERESPPPRPRAVGAPPGQIVRAATVSVADDRTYERPEQLASRSVFLGASRPRSRR